MAQDLTVNIKTTSDVPQAMDRAKSATVGFGKQVEDIQKKFSTGFKDIFLGFTAPMILIQSAISYMSAQMEQARRDAKEGLDLIAQGKMPVTIALFIAPGFTPDPKNPNGKDKKGKALGKSNRSFEYDSVTDLYVKFLLEEMIPLAESKGVKFSKDPARRAIAGASSGGICAFNAAWHRPDSFSKVFTTIGSFTNIRGVISKGLAESQRKLIKYAVRTQLKPT